MAARDASGGIQIILYNGQNPGQGPADDTGKDIDVNYIAAFNRPE